MVTSTWKDADDFDIPSTTAEGTRFSLGDLYPFDFSRGGGGVTHYNCHNGKLVPEYDYDDILWGVIQDIENNTEGAQLNSPYFNDDNVDPEIADHLAGWLEKRRLYISG
jgi:hypothetical protein